MIKVCKQKTFDRLSLCGKIFSKGLQLFVLLWIPIGVYLFLNNFDDSIGILGLIFGALGTFLFIPILRSDGDNYETILHDVNSKIKFFAWREDC